MSDQVWFSLEPRDRTKDNRKPRYFNTYEEADAVRGFLAGDLVIKPLALMHATVYQA